MRLSLLIWLAAAACVHAQPLHWPWSKSAAQHQPQEAQEAQAQEQQQEKKQSRFFRLPWNSRTTEQTRLNAAMAPKPTSREEQIMKPDLTKEFNPSAANFGSGRSVSGKKTATSEFQFVDKTRTKSFATKELATKSAAGVSTEYGTKTAETKESWFARLTSPTKTYATRESSDANRNLQGAVLPGSEQKFIARGRRQAELEKSAAATRIPFGGSRDVGESWSGDVRPLSIQDVKSLLNKN